MAYLSSIVARLLLVANSRVQIEDRVRRVLRVWEDWSILTPMYLTGLECEYSTVKGRNYCTQFQTNFDRGL